MGLSAGSTFHHEAEAPAARQRQHVAAVDVGAHIGHLLLREGIHHHDVRLAVLLVELAGVGALEDGDDHGHLLGADAVHVEHALCAAATAGETGLLVLAVHHVEDVVIRCAHREVQVLRTTEGVEALVVGGAEHVVAAHAVVALAAEVEGAPIGVHEGVVLVEVGVDVAGELHGRREAAIGQQFGAVDVAAGASVLAQAAEVDGPAAIGQVDQAAVLALLVQAGHQLLGRHHDAPPDIAQFIEAEELAVLHLHLAAHADVLEAGEQFLAVAALLLETFHRPFRQGLLVAGATETLVGHLGLLEPVIEVVGTAQPIPGSGGSGGVLGGELEMTDGHLLVIAAMQQAGPEAVVQFAIARCEAHQLRVHGCGLGKTTLLEQGIRLDAQLLVTALGRNQQREKQRNNYDHRTGRHPRVGPCTAVWYPGFHCSSRGRPARVMRFSSPRNRRPMFSRWV